MRRALRLPPGLDGIFPGKAAVAEAAGGVGGDLVQGVQAQEAQAVRADHRPDLLRGIVACDQVFLVRDIGAKIAGRDERRRGGAHVDLFCPRLPQQIDDLAGGGAPDDGIVHHHDPSALHAALQGPQLDAHRLLPALLAGGDKGAADVTVFYQAYPVGNTGLLGVAHGGVQTGIRHADDHVGLHRVLLRQKAPRQAAGIMHGLTAEDRIRPGEVDIFKYAHVAAGALAVVPEGPHLALFHHDDLTRVQLPLKFRPHGAQGAGFGGKHDGIAPAAHALGSKRKNANCVGQRAS